MIENTKHQEIISNLLVFTQEKVVFFLEEHPNETYYAFAYDCNAEYGEVNLCFNTEEQFEKSLKEYQIRHPEGYSSVDDILNLKYNTGDWYYQCFETMYVLTETEIENIYAENIDTQIKELMSIFTETLIQFRNTEECKQISKANNFKLICIDHDENPLDILDRIQ